MVDFGRKVQRLEVENRELRDRVLSLERQAEHLLAALERESALLQRISDSRDNLVDKIVEMKREGFTPAPFGAVGNSEKLDLSLDDTVLDAIDARSTEGTQLRAQLIRFGLAAMREEGADPERVAQIILQGGSPPVYEEEERLSESPG